MGFAIVVAAALALRSPQVLRMRDSVTNQEISLVGTVHYNPASVARSKEEVRLVISQKEKLGAVVVESCTNRWERSAELAPPGSLISNFIRSEMQAVAGVALQNDIPVMLGDADAGPFLQRVRELAKSTAKQLADPLGGGWASIYRDLARTLPGTINPKDVASSELLLDGEAPIGPADFAQKEMLLGFLASLVRYPAAFALKAPVPFGIFAASLYTLEATANQLDSLADASISAGEVVSLPVAATLIFSAVGTGLNVLLARLLLVAFLEERNAELARSIRRAAAEKDGPVVAVLGGLHVNGVARLLMSEETPDADKEAWGRDADGVWWEPPPDLDAKKWAYE